MCNWKALTVVMSSGKMTEYLSILMKLNLNTFFIKWIICCGQSCYKLSAFVEKQCVHIANGLSYGWHEWKRPALQFRCVALGVFHLNRVVAN